jgi:hypothetical protein
VCFLQFFDFRSKAGNVFLAQFSSFHGYVLLLTCSLADHAADEGRT